MFFVEDECIEFFFTAIVSVSNHRKKDFERKDVDAENVPEKNQNGFISRFGNEKKFEVDRYLVNDMCTRPTFAETLANLQPKMGTCFCFFFTVIDKSMGQSRSIFWYYWRSDASKWTRWIKSVEKFYSRAPTRYHFTRSHPWVGSFARREDFQLSNWKHDRCFLGKRLHERRLSRHLLWNERYRRNRLTIRS